MASLVNGSGKGSEGHWLCQRMRGLLRERGCGPVIGIARSPSVGRLRQHGWRAQMKSLGIALESVGGGGKVLLESEELRNLLRLAADLAPQRQDRSDAGSLQVEEEAVRHRAVRATAIKVDGGVDSPTKL